MLQIREALGLSQSELVKYLGLAGKISRAKISEFERGEREQTLLILLEYARAAGVCIDVLVDDKINIPKKLPQILKHKGM